MSVSFVSSVKWFLLLIFHLILTAIFAWLTWAFWGLYAQEKLSTQYQKEGQLVTVTVSDYNTDKKIWTDNWQNVKYISFPYQGKQYTTRYVQDTLFVFEGTKVPLLYLPSSDAFMQPGSKVYDFRSNQSRLIEWASVSLLSPVNKALMACVFVSIAFFFLLSGLVARIPGLYFITSISGFVFTILLLIGAVYLIYDAYTYYNYYRQVKDAGERRTVTVLDKERYSLYNNKSGSDIDPFRYVYAATVGINNAEKIMPVSENDYDKIKKGSQLDAYYNASLDDMMATDYSMNPSLFIFTGIVWLLLLYAVRNRIKRNKRNNGLT